MYTEKVMDHFQNPRNVGEIENASGVGTVGNAKCGDIMRIYLDIDENQIIQDVKFKTFGCGAAVATSSMATELVKGKSIYEALKGKIKNVSPTYSLMCDCLYNLQAIHNEIEKEIKPRIKELKKNTSKDRRQAVINICAQLSTNTYFRMDIMKDAIKHVLGDSFLKEEEKSNAS